MSTNDYGIKLVTLPGFFLQSDPATLGAGFDYAAVNFGLVPRTYDTPPPPSSSSPVVDSIDSPNPTPPPSSSWTRLIAHIHTLNTTSPSPSPPPSHKLFFLARHGQGTPNLASAQHGPLWDTHYSLLPIFSDPPLTTTGIAQARAASAAWNALLRESPALAPERYFVSPLRRCIQTARYTFEELDLPRDRPFAPTVMEGLREAICPHTCDRRARESEIEKMVAPGWRFEDGFPEEDPFWSTTYTETEAEGRARVKMAFAAIFADAPDAAVVSVTAHSGAIRSMLGMLGHRPFDLGTGQIIPVLVRAEWVPKEA